MKFKDIIFVFWLSLVFIITSNIYQSFAESLVVTTEPWQERFLTSNWRYAFALFYLLLLSLWHGLAVAYIPSSKYPNIFFIHKSLLMPLIIAVALVGLVPFEWDFATEIPFSLFVLFFFWLVFVGDVFNYFGRCIATSEWFRIKILKQEELGGHVLFRGISGLRGIVIFHLCIALIFLGRLATY